MISTAEIIRVSVGGILLPLGLLTVLPGHVASAADQENKSAELREFGGEGGEGLPCNIAPGKNRATAEQHGNVASRLITGELIRMDGMNFVLKEESGTEVEFRLTEKTRKTPLNQGDRISVSLDNENNAQWIRANRGTSRRNEHASSDCNPNEQPSEQLMKNQQSK